MFRFQIQAIFCTWQATFLGLVLAGFGLFKQALVDFFPGFFSKIAFQWLPEFLSLHVCVSFCCYSHTFTLLLMRIPSPKSMTVRHILICLKMTSVFLSKMSNTRTILSNLSILSFRSTKLNRILKISWRKPNLSKKIQNSIVTTSSITTCFLPAPAQSDGPKELLKLAIVLLVKQIPSTSPYHFSTRQLSCITY